MWARRLTVPPFHPNRVLDERRYVLDVAARSYRPADAPGAAIHVRRPSGRNLHRRVADLLPGGALFWYSGQSAPHRRGALMAYLPGPDGAYWTWYAALAEAVPAWRFTRLKGISPEEFAALERAAAAIPTDV